MSEQAIPTSVETSSEPAKKKKTRNMGEIRVMQQVNGGYAFVDDAPKFTKVPEADAFIKKLCEDQPEDAAAPEQERSTSYMIVRVVKGYKHSVKREITRTVSEFKP